MKQKLGQFYTTNVNYIFQGMEDVITDKNLIDPFAGQCDLIEWGMDNGANSYEIYDIDPKTDDTITKDTLTSSVDYSNNFILTNPPYLLRNKSDDKTLYDLYNTDDLYKCFILSFIPTAAEGLIIIPLNFLSGEHNKLRTAFFKHFNIIKVSLFEEQVFKDTSSTVIAMHFEKGDLCNFPITIFPSGRVIDCVLLEKYGYRYGSEFFEYCDIKSNIGVIRLRENSDVPQSKIVMNCLDGGSNTNRIRLTIEKEPFYGKVSDRTKAHLVFTIDIPIEKQEKLVQLFNEKIEYFREKYHSLFLSNYRESSSLYARKRLGFKMGYSFVKAIIEREGL